MHRTSPRWGRRDRIYGDVFSLYDLRGIHQPGLAGFAAGRGVARHAAPLGVPLDSAGVLSMIVAGGTVVASLSADRMLHRFGTGRVTLVSVTMTACALLGYALAPGFWWLALAAVPMGLGAGAVDAGLNNFVALHYEARHMSWLHCFWGVGATLGPVILSLFLGGKHGWRGGYGAVCAIQFCLVAVLAVTLPMWDRYEDRAALRAEAAAAKQAGKNKAR